MEKTGFICSTSVHIMHPSKEGITITQMIAVKYLSSALILLCWCHQFSKQRCHCPLPSYAACPLWHGTVDLTEWKINDWFCMNPLFKFHGFLSLYCGLFQHNSFTVPLPWLFLFSVIYNILHTLCIYEMMYTNKYNYVGVKSLMWSHVK